MMKSCKAAEVISSKLQSCIRNQYKSQRWPKSKDKPSQLNAKMTKSCKLVEEISTKFQSHIRNQYKSQSWTRNQDKPSKLIEKWIKSRKVAGEIFRKLQSCRRNQRNPRKKTGNQEKLSRLNEKRKKLQSCMKNGDKSSSFKIANLHDKWIQIQKWNEKKNTNLHEKPEQRCKAV